MNTPGTHSCGYHCSIPACIKSQRDYLAKRVEALENAQPQPVGYVYWNKGHSEGALNVQTLKPGTPLYAAPLSQPVQPAKPKGDHDSEAAAQALYESWHSLPGYVPWQAGGNSEMQEQARAITQPKESK